VNDVVFMRFNKRSKAAQDNVKAYFQKPKVDLAADINHAFTASLAFASTSLTTSTPVSNVNASTSQFAETDAKLKELLDQQQIDASLDEVLGAAESEEQTDDEIETEEDSMSSSHV